MSESKRQKVDPESLEFGVSIKGQGLIQGLDFARFVDHKAVALAVEEHLAKQDVVEEQLTKRDEDATHETNKKEERVLKLVQTLFPQAIRVDWEEEGGIEDPDFAQYYEGSRFNLAEEFDLEYSLDVYIGFSTPDDPKCEENDSGIGLSFDASLKTEATDEKVYFEFDQRRFCFHITNWQTDTVNPTAEQVHEMLLMLVKQEIGGVEAQCLEEHLKELNMKKEMAACPRFLPETE